MWKRTALLLVLISGLTPGDAGASDPQDVWMCESLFANNSPGLYMRGDFGQPVPINDKRTNYNKDSRLYYLAADTNGRPFRVIRETVWHVRTQTIANSAKANETILWRPQIATRCSGGHPLDGFDSDSRFVSLQRYRDHHASGSTRRVDSDVRSRFHFPIEDPVDGRCHDDSRTDTPRVVGNLHATYGFDDVHPDQVLLARLATVNRAVGLDSKIYSGLTSELAHAGPGEVACFGFIVPLPTRSSVTTQIVTWWRDSEAQAQALTWQPEQTSVAIQAIPNGGRLSAAVIRWNQTPPMNTGRR